MGPAHKPSLHPPTAMHFPPNLETASCPTSLSSGSLQQLSEIRWAAQGRPLRGEETSAQTLGIQGKAQLARTHGLNQEQEMEGSGRGGGGSGGEG